VRLLLKVLQVRESSPIASHGAYVDVAGAGADSNDACAARDVLVHEWPQVLVFATAFTPERV
jgi:hypothetical protein